MKAELSPDAFAQVAGYFGVRIHCTTVLKYVTDVPDLYEFANINFIWTRKDQVEDI